MESLVLKVYTIDGREYNVRQYREEGVERQFSSRIPKAIAAGVWVDESTFIPGTAIVRAEIVVGKGAEFGE